jgi:hypothetical protein
VNSGIWTQKQADKKLASYEKLIAGLKKMAVSHLVK